MTVKLTDRCAHVGETLLGPICITMSGQAVISLDMATTAMPINSGKPPELLAMAFAQLREYLACQRRVFDLPLAPVGTPFQQRVWSELIAIPYGSVATYGQIAQRAGSARAARAVGSACHSNPIPLFIPCHRVIAANGKLGGFGLGLDMKRQLLSLEQNQAW